MNELDEQKALSMMDLNPDATKDEIAKRYGVLARKFRTIKQDENGYTIEDITSAYNLLMGITYKDDKEQERQKALRENPPLLAKVLKKDPVKLENFFHYYKWHMLIAAVLLVVVAFTVRSCVNRVPSDLTVIMTGYMFAEDETIIEADIAEKLPELKAPDVLTMGSDGSDLQFEYTVQMKLMAMLTAEDVDIIFMDQSKFESLSRQGVLLPLEDQMSALPFSAEDYVQGAIDLEESDEGEPVYGLPAAYGVDITQSSFVKDNYIYGEKIIAGIAINSKHMESALKLLGQFKP